MRATTLAATVMGLGLVTCGSPPPPSPPSPPPSAVSSASGASSVPVAPDPTLRAVVPTNDVASPAALPETTLGAFTHELDQPVTSIALGEKRVAALGADAFLADKDRLQKIALPVALRPSSEGSARIFFGRDDLPRIMGTRLHEGAPAQLYARYRGGRWIAEKSEVGRLLSPPGKPLWGVLGHADPEVACKHDDVCIIKRLTGWKTIAAGTGTPLVELFGGAAWALHPDHVAKLDADTRWIEAGVQVGKAAPFAHATGIAVVGEDIWITEAGTDSLHRYVAGSWTTERSPVREPRGLWVAARDDVWLTSAEGLAHHDGKGWSLVRGVRGPVSEIRARGTEIWVGGSSGVWVSRTR